MCVIRMSSSLTEGVVVFIIYFYDSGSFKTLDKDNNGTIKVNVQEVK